MKEVHIADGIVPLGEFKAQAAKYLKRLGESGEPVVITQNGRPAGVLVAPAEFDRRQERGHHRTSPSAKRLSSRALPRMRVLWTAHRAKSFDTIC